uniref:Uncharacterized protein n=1 Tax=Tanacetum cinerariifolium TaxID=118510 RepID=A0A6L2N578_TANCI|nr:hypothetical protein [Tanacetum cinerariifolium]
MLGDGYSIRTRTVICNDSLIAIAKYCLNLEELVLIGFDACCINLEAIDVNFRKLERLDLCSSNTITDFEISYIAKKMCCIEEVSIKQCCVSDKGVEDFALGCLNLVRIRITKCENVTREVKDRLRSRKRSLVVKLDALKSKIVYTIMGDNGVQEHVAEFAKVNLDPDEENHPKFRMRVLPKIENLKGEHLLELVNKDVKFAKLDDEDVIWGLETFSNSIHWWCKDENVIPLSVALEEKLKPGLSDVDHLDKTDNLSKNAYDCSLDQQSMGGVSQCMKVDEQYKNDVLDNFHADVLDHKSVEGVSQCTSLNEEYKSVVVDGLISFWSQDVGHLSKVRELINGVFHTPSVQDACVSELLDVVKDDVNVNSVVKEEIVKYDVNVNSLVKEDIEKDNVHVDNGNELDFSMVSRATQKEAGYLLLEPNADWAMASPYLRDMLSRFQYPLYYANGVKYDVPWFANNVQKMIIDLQLHLNSVEKKLKPGPSDVGHLDKSMGGVSQCMNVDEPYKNWNDVSDNFYVDGLDHKMLVIFLRNLLSSILLNLKSRTMKKLVILMFVYLHNSVEKEEIMKDDVNVNSLVKEDIEKDDVHVDSFVKEDIKKDDV